VALGAAIGAALGQVATGVGLGAALGVVFGASLENRNCETCEQAEELGRKDG
jgi:hypothetical protein